MQLQVGRNYVIRGAVGDTVASLDGIEPSSVRGLLTYTVFDLKRKRKLRFCNEERFKWEADEGDVAFYVNGITQKPRAEFCPAFFTAPGWRRRVFA